MRELVKNDDVTNVLVEGGASVQGALLEQGLADEILAFIAPSLMGDEAARSAVTGLTCEAMTDVTELKLHAVERLGDDILLDYFV